MNKEEKLEKCLKWFDTLKIGNTIQDIKYERNNEITNITSNSLELYHTKVSNKGINCYQWYSADKLIYLTNDYL